MINTDLYTGAVIRLATLQSQRDRPGRLLFASVSLLPCGRPLPPPMKGKGIDQHSLNGTGGTVFFRRVLLGVQEAIDWYRALGTGDDRTPVPFRPEDRISKYDGIEIDVSRLIDNPAWPSLGLPIGEGFFAHPSGRSHPAPFIGATPARVHRRFGSQDGFDSMLADHKAVAFIARRLHIDLRLYREYLGSAVMIASDPVLKQVDCFMIPASENEGERIFYRFVPRAGQSLSGLQLTTFDEQTHLLTDFNTRDIPPNGILDIDKGDCIGTYGYVVTHDQHGVLAYSPPAPFLRQVGINVNPTSRGKKVRVPIGEAADSPSMEYQAAQPSQPSSPRLVGDPPRIQDANHRVSTAASSRKKLASARQYGQRWFPDGSREEAMRFVQSELRRASSRVIIADPYLAGLQLGQYLYAVNPATTSVTLLTSRLAFKSKKQIPSKADDFSFQLDQLKDKAGVTAETYVLPSSILHDRFLVIDDDVWFLGNSLNTLGDKASLIVKLPNPNEVIDQLKDMLNHAIPFDEYKKQRAKSKDADS
ncbi:MAG: hypothetical protein HLX50_15765 [Alteromonadaceae bacterium]|nr:hypothetical protein [Alteromonadaceae bacterium]